MPSRDDVLRGSFLALLQCADAIGLQHEQLAELCNGLEVEPFNDGHTHAPHTLSAVVSSEALPLPKWLGSANTTSDPRAVVVDVELIDGKESQRFAFANSKAELSRVIAWAAPPRIRHVRASAYLHEHRAWPKALRFQEQ